MSVIETAPTFDLPGVDGRNHTLEEYAGASVLVLVQSCNHCPYVIAWEGRINDLQREYADRGVRIVAISSNDAVAYPADSFDAMVEHARGAGYVFDYLYDESQEIGRALGSERTPEAFVFDADRRPRLPRRCRRRPRGVAGHDALSPRRDRSRARGRGTADRRHPAGRLHGQVAHLSTLRL